MIADRFTHPALVVVDMQNDFVRVGAPLEVPEARETIPVHRELIAFCRRREIPIGYTKFVAGPGRTLIWEWSRMLAPPIRCCWPGHRRHYDDVGKALDGDAIIEGLDARREPRQQLQALIAALGGMGREGQIPQLGEPALGPERGPEGEAAVHGDGVPWPHQFW